MAKRTVMTYRQTGLEVCDRCGGTVQVTRVGDQWLCLRHTCAACGAQAADGPLRLCPECREARSLAR